MQLRKWIQKHTEKKLDDASSDTPYRTLQEIPDSPENETIKKYSDLLENFQQTVDKLFPNDGINIQVKEKTPEAYQKKYQKLCHKYKSKFFSLLKDYDIDTSTLDADLMRDCAIHYCYKDTKNRVSFKRTFKLAKAIDLGRALYQERNDNALVVFLAQYESIDYDYLVKLLKANPVIPDNSLLKFSITQLCRSSPNKAEELLESIIHDPKNINLAKILIKEGTKLNDATILHLVAFKWPFDMIKQLDDHPIQKASYSLSYKHENPLIAGYLFFAAFHPDPQVLEFFHDRNPNDALKILCKIIHDGMVVQFTPKLSISPNESRIAIDKILNLLKNNNKFVSEKFFFHYLRSCLKHAKSIDEYLEIYEQYRLYKKPQQLNPSTIFSAAPYTNEKIQFIEEIQKAIFSCFMNFKNRADVTTDMLDCYLPIIIDALEHDVFSVNHDKMGVNASYRNDLIAEISKMKSELDDRMAKPYSFFPGV